MEHDLFGKPMSILGSSPRTSFSGSCSKTQLALAALLAGLLLAALLAALTARLLLLLTGFLLAGILLAALLTAMLAVLFAVLFAVLAALLAALIGIVGHWKRLLIAGWPRKVSTNYRNVGSERRGRNLRAI
jgi:hypothetical protein